jgi:uncharacterized HAD superfamily protein
LRKIMAKIGVDLDGVCYDFAGSLKHFLVEHEGFNPDDLGDPTCWEFYDKDWGLHLNEFLEHFAEGVDRGIVFVHGDPHQGTVETLTRLKDDGHTIHIVTHRQVGQLSTENTMYWLKKHGIPHDTITFSKDKTIVNNDYFIEDNVDNHLSLEAAGVRSVLMDRPWNEHHNTWARIRNWDEFYEWISYWERVKNV